MTVVIEMQRRRVLEYGCCRCQSHHREGAPFFQAHLFFQSKHGVREVVLDGEWVPRGVLG